MSRRPAEIGSAQSSMERVAGSQPARLRVHLYPKQAVGRKARIGSKPTKQLAST